MSLKCLAILLFAVFYFCPNLSLGTKKKAKEYCNVSHGVKQFYQEFVDSYVNCPPSISSCEGIGLSAAENCKTCCSLSTASPGCSSNDNSLPPWAIGIITVLGFVILVIVATYFGVRPVFFVRKKIKTPIEETHTGNPRVSYTTVEMNSSNISSSTLNGSQSLLNDMEPTNI